jgi:hypothetical protein
MTEVIDEVLSRLQKHDPEKAVLIRNSLTSLWQNRREISGVEFKIDPGSKTINSNQTKRLRACKLQGQKTLLVIKDVFEQLKGVEQAFLLLQATLFKIHLERGLTDDNYKFDENLYFAAYEMTLPYFNNALKNESYLEFINFYHKTVPPAASGYQKNYEFQIGKFFTLMTRFSSPAMGSIFELNTNGTLKKFIPARTHELSLPNGQKVSVGRQTVVSFFENGRIKRIEECPVENLSGYYDGVWKEKYISQCVYQDRIFKTIEFNLDGSVRFIDAISIFEL